MSRNPFLPGRAWRLTPTHDADAASLLRIRVGAESQAVLVPHSPGLGYFLAPASRALVSIESEDFRAERLDLLPSLWVRLRCPS